MAQTQQALRHITEEEHERLQAALARMANRPVEALFTLNADFVRFCVPRDSCMYAGIENCDTYGEIDRLSQEDASIIYEIVHGDCMELHEPAKLIVVLSMAKWLKQEVKKFTYKASDESEMLQLAAANINANVDKYEPSKSSPLRFFGARVYHAWGDSMQSEHTRATTKYYDENLALINKAKEAFASNGISDPTPEQIAVYINRNLGHRKNFTATMVTAALAQQREWVSYGAEEYESAAPDISSNPESIIIAEETSKRIRDAIAKMGPMEQKFTAIYSSHLDTHHTEIGFDDLHKQLAAVYPGISREYVKQLREGALHKLAILLNEKADDEREKDAPNGFSFLQDDADTIVEGMQYVDMDDFFRDCA